MCARSPGNKGNNGRDQTGEVMNTAPDDLVGVNMQIDMAWNAPVHRPRHRSALI